MKLARDIWLVFGRYFGLFIRNPAWVTIASAVAPAARPRNVFACLLSRVPLLLLRRWDVVFPLALAPRCRRGSAGATPRCPAAPPPRHVFRDQITDPSVTKGVAIMLV